MYTIKDLSEGRVAVINDGTVEELNKVLKEAFPDDYDHASGIDVYYYKSPYTKGHWRSCRDNLVKPIQSVKDFLSQLEFKPKRGDRVLVSNEGMSWVERIYLCTIEGAKEPTICVKGGCEYAFSENMDFQITSGKMMKPLPKEEPIVKTELTMQQIADKFGIEVDNLQIIK